MTDWKYVFSVAFLGLCFYSGITNVQAKSLLGTEVCTQGPAYWCYNLTNAKNCRAVRHCIQTVWEKQRLPVDNDDVCKICVDMVKQARDQLESNQTQEDLKAVFDGSCRLIPIKIISEECIKLVNDFVPELVETLSSQMNPQVVCSVAGLCNSARIDKLLEERKNQPAVAIPDQVDQTAGMCKECHLVANKMKRNFDSLSYDEFLEKIIRGCGKLGSFSDSCAGLVFSHFEDIYSHMKNDFNADNVCHLAGTCSEHFHQHEDDTEVAVEVKSSGDSGKLTSESDDLPCEFCEKLVEHLRDIMLANTTDIEFKRVLEGICKQTGSFSQECLSLIDQYYLNVYNYLVGELDPEGLCFMAGICRKGKNETGPLAPLLPSELVIKALKPIEDQQLIGTDEANSYQKPLAHVSLKKNEANVKVISPEVAQLPIERMMVRLPENKAVCTFCQYFLHYLQVEISDASNEEKIKEAVESGCDKLPSSFKEECTSFVDAYGNMVIALLVQKIDPAEVCPSLGLCAQREVKNVEILMTGSSGDKPNCPLCLFAIQQLESVLESNRTEKDVERALDSLCNHLSVKLRGECVSFVDEYYKQLVDVLVAEFTPQEVCVYLKLCQNDSPGHSVHRQKIDSYHSQPSIMADHNNFRKPVLPDYMLANAANGANGDIETNEIPDNTVNGVPVVAAAQISTGNKKVASPGCVICEWVVTRLDKMLANNNTVEELKTLIHDACSILPKNATQECNVFVNKYADLVIVMLTQDMKPREVCDVLAFCIGKANIQESVLDCVVCEESVYAIEKILDNPNVDHKIEHIIEKTCNAVPAKYYDRCFNLVQTYGESIIHLLATLPNSHSICTKIGLCGDSARVDVSRSYRRNRRETERPLVGQKKCTWGPAYWCDTLDQANECNALVHCRERVWFGDSPPASQVKQ